MPQPPQQIQPSLLHPQKPACTNSVLSMDGDVEYVSAMIPVTDANHYLDKLVAQTDWKQDVVVMFGKKTVMRRKYAWYADDAAVYRYAGKDRHGLAWTPLLLQIRKLVENASGENYNSCLLNFYHDGDDGMGWHRDAEPEMKKHAAIASLSLGAERKFTFKHRQSKERVSLTLENGSLLVMKGSTQDHWLHCLPKSKKVSTARLNLTFRTVVSD